MSSLKSESMALSSSERRWLPWFGANNLFGLKWSCFLNRKMYPVIERTFEGIAATRVKLIQSWAESHWAHLSHLADDLTYSLNTITPCLEPHQQPSWQCSDQPKVDLQARPDIASLSDGRYESSTRRRPPPALPVRRLAAGHSIASSG